MKIKRISKFSDDGRFQGFNSKVEEGQAKTEDGDQIQGGGYYCLAVLDKKKLARQRKKRFNKHMDGTFKKYLGRPREETKNSNGWLSRRTNDHG